MVTPLFQAPVPVLRILLPLLLCLSLIASATGSVWAATAMAMPATTMAMDADHACCHDEGGMHADTTAPQPMELCGDGKHCDCMQHCNMLPTQALPPLSGVPQTAQPSASTQARDDAAPAQLNRPPIA
ncbi:hypothetical protein ARC78_13070 [Stenotrophomonas pictorum JCM 9942]|jgi:hypothetical protein|uniref:CopL family metal-binding regulatory protein n=2 Tax=Stenotrophomonas pictorum TaxID=86184 RepID=A0A0R0AGY0_9GAMM|nr:hypothetical protein ARC78_13070 [Stenotrophomonas pictorum JCM 9942]